MRDALDILAARGAAILRDRNVRVQLREALPAILASVVVPPLVVLAVQWIQRLGGHAPWQPGAFALVAAMALTALGVALLVTNLARRLPVDRRAALGLLDKAVGAEERLVTADVFLRDGADDTFAAAAIADARWFLRPAARAYPAALALPARTTRMSRGALFALAGLVLLYSALNPPAVPATVTMAAAPDDPYRIPDLPDERTPTRRTVPPIEEPPKVTSQAPTLLDSKTSESQAATRPTEVPDDVTRKEGKGGAGRSAEAQASRGESDARGSPSNQGQESKKPTVKKPLPKKKKAKKRKKKPSSDEDPEPSTGDESGSTAGRGSSQGSNKNAVSSDWTSKDQVTTEEDADIEDDEQVQDEEVDSEARGGVQPNLRNRKPPVSRDLTIGFGNQPNPNANGRGGPSQPKKSRGTASLVLGVPIPDRIKGQPNAGKTKVTQERVEPQQEPAPPETGAARGTRQGPSGVLARPELTPWMRAMLRTWFLRMRQQENTTR